MSRTTWEIRVNDTWLDGWDNDTGSTVGHLEEPFAEREIVHGGKQSMPLFYDNAVSPWYCEADRIWKTAQNWTSNGADTLELYFRGKADNTPEWLYIVVADRAGHVAVVTHPNANALLRTEWQAWHVPFALLRVANIDMTAITKLSIGVGDRAKPQAGGSGVVYIDDISLARPAQ